MPQDPIRVTRSGRVSKRSSRTQLIDNHASSTSRLRHRNASSNLSSSRLSRGETAANPGSTPPTSSRAAAIEELIAQEEERLHQLERERTRPEDDRQAVLESLVARREQWEEQYRSRPPRGRSSRRRSRRHHSSSVSSASSSSSSRENRASFKHLDHNLGKTLVSSICQRFPAVSQKHIEKIYRGTFDARHLLQLANSFAAPIAKNAYDINSTAKLLRCVEIYSQIVCHFVSPGASNELQKAFSHFRLKLLENTEAYTFESVREWCFSYIAARIATARSAGRSSEMRGPDAEDSANQ